jgi:hypothetical protein
MQEVEQEPGGVKRSGLPTATIVAVLCGLLVLSAVSYVIWRTSGKETNPESLVADLESKSQGFVDKVISVTFNGTKPDGFRIIGGLPLDYKGLHPAVSADPKGLGGGLVTETPISGSQPFAVDVAISPSGPTAALLLEVFVTTDAKFSETKATSSQDLIWQLSDKDQLVIKNGSTVLGGDTPVVYHPGDAVRMIVGSEVAIVEVVSADGKPRRLWAGPSDLGTGPRYVGVRFLQTGKPGKQDLSVQSIKVTTAPG